MNGQITIEQINSSKVSIRAHCRADSLDTCNRTLSYTVRPCDVTRQQGIARAELRKAGCSAINTTII